jgi:hypothetical protein
VTARHVPLVVTLATISGTLVFGVHCSGNGSMGSGFSEAQLYCQAAAMQLTSCCPEFNEGLLFCNEESTQDNQTSSSCFGTTAISSTTHYPSLTEADSLCILNQPCESLQKTGVCERAAEEVNQGPKTKTTTVVSPPPGSGCSSETYYEDAEVEAGQETDSGSNDEVDAGRVCP